MAWTTYEVIGPDGLFAQVFDLISLIVTICCCMSYYFMAAMFVVVWVLRWLLVVVLFASIWGGSLRICSVCCMLYGMMQKPYSTAIIQVKLQLVHVSLYRANCQRYTLVPPLNTGANTVPISGCGLFIVTAMFIVVGRGYCDRHVCCCRSWLLWPPC